MTKPATLWFAAWALVAFQAVATCADEPAKGHREKAKTEKSHKTSASFLPAYFKIWKTLGADQTTKGLDGAKKELVAALDQAAKAPPEKVAEKERASWRQRLTAARGLAEKLEVSDLKKARESFGPLSAELKKVVETFPKAAEAYVVYCPMAKKNWLQDRPEVLNPYHGSEMPKCGKVVHKPGSPAEERKKGHEDGHDHEHGDKKGGEGSGGHHEGHKH